MNEDLERAEAGPSVQHTDNDGQREEQVRVATRNGLNNVATTPGDSSALVAVWMQRLQILTFITTFLASIDGGLFELTTPSQMPLQEFVYACFAGALVFHVCASILGYIASFALIRYQLSDVAPSDTKNTERTLMTIPPFDAMSTFFQVVPLNSGLQITSRTSIPPLDLLTRCYFTTLALSSIGFILALLGIAGYAWVILQQVVGIFTVVCLGVSIVASVWAVL
ncbi:uncharacterized protein EDB93DRAFT_1158104 [Suillus bovinus]|uniref:uncharacterized protein n=1 Tax=Suillus bovinus TaxID=48563 RepID=UPI001B87E748|nr:uncharacterized protein EDB93DRAFT_1158104 [Suillus bovinus]KAG2142252.1 hypothetical protein EDB93DRAFT_1158104 [Suillus bovinus]